jgi:glutaminase
LTEAGCKDGDDDTCNYTDCNSEYCNKQSVNIGLLSDPTCSHAAVPSNEAPLLLTAAAAGDLDEVLKLRAIVDVGVTDYDARSALHLAACEGHLHVLKYLVMNYEGDPACFVEACDRWGNSALDDAERYGHVDCAEYLNGVLQA